MVEVLLREREHRSGRNWTAREDETRLEQLIGGGQRECSRVPGSLD